MTREQERAALAFGDVKGVEAKDFKSKYATMAMKGPSLLKTAGLVQTIEFIRARPKDEGASTYVQHLAGQLRRVDHNITNADSLARACREEKDLARYLLLTREAAAVMLWYRRFAQSVLKASDTDEAGEA